MTDIKERGDQMEEDCGVFGIYAQDEHINAAEAAYYGLFALQHRGQESAGIAVADGKGIKHYRNLGLVPEVFDEEILGGLKGKISIGHVRYSTFGGKDVINAQPLVARCKIGMLAVAHNGNLVNADALRSQMEEDGAIFQTTVDTEVILSLIARESSKGLVDAIRSMMNVVRGSYALVLLAKDKLIGIRDPYGIRPLCLGRVGNSFVLASESCALDAVGAEFVRDVQPGEIVVIDEDGIHSTRVKTPMRSRLCLFEFVYFARPDSVIDGINVYQSRVEAGKRLAMDDDVEADMVIGVPGQRACRRDGLRAAERYSLRRRTRQKPLCRAHVYPAGAGHARAGRADEAECADAQCPRQAADSGGRLHRPRNDEPKDRRDAADGRCERGSYAHFVSVGAESLLFRH